MKSFLYIHLKQKDSYEYLLMNADTITDVMRNKEKRVRIFTGKGVLAFDKDEALEIITNNKPIGRFLENIGLVVEYEKE